MLLVPIEVFEAVVDNTDRRSLHHLSLTCRTFLPRTRYHLFTSIRIQTLKQMESSREFFDAHQWILPLVREVTLSVNILLPPDNTIRNIRVLDVVPLHLLTQFSNLRVWRMRVLRKVGFDVVDIMTTEKAWLSLHRFPLSCYQRYGGRVQTLDLSNIPFYHLADFTGLVSALPNIQNLTCVLIRFRSTDGHTTSLHDPLHDPSFMFARSLKVTSLRIGPSVDIRATKHLLLASAATLNNLRLSVRTIGSQEDSLDSFLTSLSWHQYPQLSSLSLVVSFWNNCGEDHNADWGCWGILSDICRIASILKHISRTQIRLREVQVEFETDPIANLGDCLSLDGSLEACEALEEALFAFPVHRILCHDPVSQGRSGRAEFWSPTIKRAFPRLEARGLLDIPYVKAGSSDPPGHELLVLCLIISSDSKTIMTASQDGTIIIWDAESGMIAQEWLAHQHSVDAIALSPDGRRLISAGGVGNQTLVVWDIDNGVRRDAAPQGHTQPAATCAWSPGGGLFASASTDGTVRIWDARTFQQRDLLEDPEAICLPRRLQFSPDGRYLAWISYSDATDCHSWSIWSLLADERLKTFPSYSNRREFDVCCVSGLSFDCESKRIATSHGNWGGPLEDHVVRIWDIQTGAPLAVLAGHMKPVTDVWFSSNGRSVLSASWDGSAKVWDTESGKEMASFVGDEEQFMEAHFSPDEKYIATTSVGGRVRLWRTDDCSCTVVFSEHTCNVLHIAFSPDGRFLASGDLRGIVHIRRLSDFV